MNPRAVSAIVLACMALGAIAPDTHAQGLRPSNAGSGTGLGLPRGAGSTTIAATLQQADYIVAVVNSEPITNNEVLERLRRVEQQMAQQQGASASMPPREVLARQVLERLINEKAQLQFARESGIRIDDLVVDQAEQSVARQNQIDVPEMHRRLAADGISLDRFRGELRNQITLTRLRDREVESRVKVSDSDVEQYIREQQNSSDATGMQVNLAHIFVRVPEDATPVQASELQAKAQDAARRIRAGEDFGALAREYSDAPERVNGGILGLRPADNYPQLFIDTTRSLRTGEVAGPVRSPAGFHILKVLERERLGMPATVVTQSHARHILLHPGARLTEAEAAARLEDYKRRIAAGLADFAALAREYSQDASAKAGGDLGWASPGQFVPEFEDAMDALAPGEISDPVISRFGVHLIQLIERRQTTLSPREQREMVRNIVREKKLDEAFANWAQEVRGRAYVEYREPPQ
ncbi:peptidylprolyl isomerase [Ramlibacter sp. H39-3-26]|uniref:peptidylprolyl isomerase n=1 Tax=Curvibacter soli TaxID=3031331 RepID=UPI0023DBF5E2|nr:peptidylprolyl isomerase [Ramlibacter sp. H39-3-26]MDF1485566.1 peptidylprolyl isomerase [Ramlibacter sp. H39-3-26]